MIYPPPQITREDLPLKLSVRFTPLKSPGKIYPSNCLYDLPLLPEIAFIFTFLPTKGDIN